MGARAFSKYLKQNVCPNLYAYGHFLETKKLSPEYKCSFQIYTTQQSQVRNGQSTWLFPKSAPITQNQLWTIQRSSREFFEPCSLTIKDIYFFYLSQVIKFLDSFSLMMSQTHVHH